MDQAAGLPRDPPGDPYWPRHAYPLSISSTMKLPPEVREQFRRHGRSGGRERARRLPAERRTRIARMASLARWTRDRFGAPCFADLGLPGADLVDQGIADAAAEVESVASLIVAIAESRLRREGVPVPNVRCLDPEMRCYRLLEKEMGDLAHARYCALLDQMHSFADSCHLVRRRS